MSGPRLGVPKLNTANTWLKSSYIACNQSLSFTVVCVTSLLSRESEEIVRGIDIFQFQDGFGQHRFQAVSQAAVYFI